MIPGRLFPLFMVTAALAASVAGCSQKESGEPGVVDHLSGSEQLQTYKKARAKIEDLSKALEERGQEIQ